MLSTLFLCISHGPDYHRLLEKDGSLRLVKFTMCIVITAAGEIRSRLLVIATRLNAKSFGGKRPEVSDCAVWQAARLIAVF